MLIFFKNMSVCKCVIYRNDNDNAGYFQLLSRTDTIVKLLQSAALLFVLFRFCCRFVFLLFFLWSLYSNSPHVRLPFKLALMGFHLSWMPYTFIICMYPLYTYRGRGIVNWELELGSAAATWSFNWTMASRFWGRHFNFHYRSDISLACRSLCRSVRFLIRSSIYYTYTSISILFSIRIRIANQTLASLGNDQYNVIYVFLLFFYSSTPTPTCAQQAAAKVKVKKTSQNKKKKTNSTRTAEMQFKFLERVQKEETNKIDDKQN